LCLLCAFSVAGLSGPHNAGEVSNSIYQREIPEDPPGRPALPTPGATQSAPIRFGIATTFQVNVDGAGANIVGDAANEPSIAVDPNNPNVMAIGWRQFDTIASNFRQAGWAYTTDGGRTWTSPGVLEPGVFRSDPVLGFDATGVFYYNSLKVIGNDFSTQMFTSVDGGMTWGAPVKAWGGDKLWFTVDRTGSVGHGNIYAAWNTAAGCCNDSTFNRSTDGALSFEYPEPIRGFPIFGTLDVDSNGDVYVVGVNNIIFSTFYCVKSASAKYAAATPTFGSPVAVPMLGTLDLGAPPNPDGLLGQVNVAVDRSGGPNHGNVYMLSTVKPSFGTDPLDVHFSRSTDGGQTWSIAQRINDDTSRPSSWQWFATMSVAPNGRIDVIWNDNRDTGAATNAMLYYSFSIDGGLTWSVNQQLSPVWASNIGWPNQNKIGDYYDMVSDNVGASLAWAATFNGEQDVYYTRIGDWDCNGNGVADSLDIATKQSADFNENGIPDECEGIQSGAGDAVAAGWRLLPNVPNPFNPETVIRYEVPDAGGRVTLRVYDVEGRLVGTLADRYERGGIRQVTWDGRDNDGRPVASGLYFYRLEAPGFSQTRKMLLLK
jgi:hypothetical protein